MAPHVHFDLADFERRSRRHLAETCQKARAVCREAGKDTTPVDLQESFMEANLILNLRLLQAMNEGRDMALVASALGIAIGNTLGQFAINTDRDDRLAARLFGALDTAMLSIINGSSADGGVMSSMRFTGQQTGSA